MKPSTFSLAILALLSTGKLNAVEARRFSHHRVNPHNNHVVGPQAGRAEGAIRRRAKAQKSDEDEINLRGEDVGTGKKSKTNGAQAQIGTRGEDEQIQGKKGKKGDGQAELQLRGEDEQLKGKKSKKDNDPMFDVRGTDEQMKGKKSKKENDQILLDVKGGKDQMPLDTRSDEKTRSKKALEYKKGKKEEPVSEYQFTSTIRGSDGSEFCQYRVDTTESNTSGNSGGGGRKTMRHLKKVQESIRTLHYRKINEEVDVDCDITELTEGDVCHSEMNGTNYYVVEGCFHQAQNSDLTYDQEKVCEALGEGKIISTRHDVDVEFRIQMHLTKEGNSTAAVDKVMDAVLNDVASQLTGCSRRRLSSVSKTGRAVGISAHPPAVMDVACDTDTSSTNTTSSIITVADNDNIDKCVVIGSGLTIYLETNKYLESAVRTNALEKVKYGCEEGFYADSANGIVALEYRDVSTQFGAPNSAEASGKSPLTFVLVALIGLGVAGGAYYFGVMRRGEHDVQACSNPDEMDKKETKIHEVDPSMVTVVAEPVGRETVKDVGEREGKEFAKVERLK